MKTKQAETPPPTKKNQKPKPKSVVIYHDVIISFPVL